MYDLIDRLGLGLCHQLPERSFFADGVQLPVCARDTGIYLGFIVSLVLLAWIHRGERPRELPGIRGFGLAVALMAFMAWDGVTSYAGVRETTNLMRLLTGTGAGFAMALMAYPMLNDVLWRRSSATRPVAATRRMALWLLGIPASIVLVPVLAVLPGRLLVILTAAAILATFAAVNLIIVGMLPMFDRHAETARDLLLPASIAFAVGLAEIWLSGSVRIALEAFIRSRT